MDEITVHRTRCSSKIKDRARLEYADPRRCRQRRICRALVYPELAWDFRLEQVRSINTSNHKYGLDLSRHGKGRVSRPARRAEELIYKITYLGGEMFNYSLNFSKPSGQILLQYYSFLRLGPRRLSAGDEQHHGATPAIWKKCCWRQVASSF